MLDGNAKSEIAEAFYLQFVKKILNSLKKKLSIDPKNDAWVLWMYEDSFYDIEP